MPLNMISNGDIFIAERDVDPYLLVIVDAAKQRCRGFFKGSYPTKWQLENLESLATVKYYETFCGRICIGKQAPIMYAKVTEFELELLRLAAHD